MSKKPVIHLGAIQALFADQAGPVGRIIERKTVEVEAVAKAYLGLPGSGKTYQPGVLTFRSGAKIYSNYDEGGTASDHQASAPGAPPTVVTGDLRASVGHKIGSEATVYGIVGTPDIVGLFMELGTHREDGSIGVAPRPWLRPALYTVIPA